MRKFILAAAVALAAVSTGAIAAVTFDPLTGTGFVGKGDVQLVYGWNNATAQKEARNVSFAYASSDTYDVTIEFETGNPDKPKTLNTHTVIQNKSTSVSSSVNSDPRKTGQYTGWNLTGFGATTTTGDAVPIVGASCPNGNLGTCEVIAVVPVSSTGGLTVSWNNSPPVPLQ